MTTHVMRIITHTIKATEDLAGAELKFVTIGGTIAQSASGHRIAGLLETNVGSGYHHGVTALGIMKAVAGAAVTSLGWPAAVANSGFVTNAASGNFSVGRFLETCNSGDIVQLMVDVINIAPAVIA